MASGQLVKVEKQAKITFQLAHRKFMQLNDHSRAFVIAQYGPHEYFSEQQKIENNAYINLVGNVVVVLHG